MISSAIRKVGPFSGNGVTTVFPFTFKVFARTDLVVVKNVAGAETTLVLDSDYTATLNADQDNNPGGSITLTTALASGATMVISSDIAQTQQVQLTNLGGFYPEVITTEFDKLTILIQQQQEELDRSIRLPITDSANSELPSSAMRANKFLTFDSNGSVALALSPEGAVNDNQYVHTTGNESVAGVKTFTGKNVFSVPQAVTDITNASAFNAFGDSITYGYGVVNPANKYVNRIAAAKGWTASNQGTNGDGVADQSNGIFATGIDLNSISTLMIGVNDMRNNGSGAPGTLSTAQQETWEANMLAVLAHLSIPDKQKIWGNTAGSSVSPVTYGGSWSAASQLGNHLYKATAPGATASVNIYGSTLYILSAWQVGNTSTYKITVDGIDVSFVVGGVASTTLHTNAGAFTTFNGKNFGPYAYRIDTAEKKLHTVTITCLSADGSNPCYFLMVAANSGATSGSGPYAYVGDVIRFADLGAGTGYGTYGGSDTAVYQHNARIKNVQSQLAADGLHTVYVNVDGNGGNAFFPSVTNTQSDGVHPTDIGHGLIANAFLAEMSGLSTPKERAAGQILMNVPVSTYKGVLANGGYPYGADAGDIGASQGPTAGNVFFGTDGSYLQRNGANWEFVSPSGISLVRFGGATSAYPALKMAGTPAKVTVRKADDSGDAALQVGSLLVNGSGTSLQQIRKFSAVAVDPGSIGATSRGSIAVTVAGTPGIAAGDVIIPVSGWNGINDDLVFEGVEATGADQVTFYFYNPTGSPIDDTSHNWDILWIDVT